MVVERSPTVGVGALRRGNLTSLRSNHRPSCRLSWQPRILTLFWAGGGASDRRARPRPLCGPLCLGLSLREAIGDRLLRALPWGSPGASPSCSGSPARGVLFVIRLSQVSRRGVLYSVLEQSLL
ncbi:hypothetical protein VNO77_37760 [Canavalia gladiata]|uniref:Uncharacterized protein n=1 Tax=Canavalia gladiata TaxID=3824 RepID=A0AAN9KAU3_CANGL